MSGSVEMPVIARMRRQHYNNARIVPDWFAGSSVTGVPPMDRNGFVRSLKAVSVGLGRRRALAGLGVAAAVPLVAGTGRSARKKRRRTKKPCLRDTCPARICCSCPGTPPFCVLLEREAPFSLAEVLLKCGEACDSDSFASATNDDDPDTTTLVCGLEAECVLVVCPI